MTVSAFVPSSAFLMQKSYNSCGIMGSDRSRSLMSESMMLKSWLYHDFRRDAGTLASVIPFKS
jgi:hypothetical protein